MGPRPHHRHAARAAGDLVAGGREGAPGRTTGAGPGLPHPLHGCRRPAGSGARPAPRVRPTRDPAPRPAGRGRSLPGGRRPGGGHRPHTPRRRPSHRPRSPPPEPPGPLRRRSRRGRSAVDGPSGQEGDRQGTGRGQRAAPQESDSPGRRLRSGREVPVPLRVPRPERGYGHGGTGRRGRRPGPGTARARVRANVRSARGVVSGRLTHGGRAVRGTAVPDPGSGPGHVRVPGRAAAAPAPGSGAVPGAGAAGGSDAWARHVPRPAPGPIRTRRLSGRGVRYAYCFPRHSRGVSRSGSCPAAARGSPPPDRHAAPLLGAGAYERTARAPCRRAGCPRSSRSARRMVTVAWPGCPWDRREHSPEDARQAPFTADEPLPPG